MIISHLRYAEHFYGLGAGIHAGLQFLERPDLISLDKGRYDLPGIDGGYALVQEHETQPLARAKWEAHRKMIDLHYMVSGQELIGYSDVSSLQMQEYHAHDDFSAGEGDGEWIRLDEQYFVILFPQDGHSPSVAVSEPKKVRKVVIKIPVETLPNPTGAGFHDGENCCRFTVTCS